MRRNLYITILLGLIIFVNHAVACINYQYDPDTHLVISISNNASTTLINSYYLSGRAFTTTMSTSGALVSYSNSYIVDPHTGYLKRHHYGHSSSILYSYSTAGIERIKNVGMKSRLAINYHYSRLGQPLVMNRHDGYSTYNHFNAMGKLSDIAIGPALNYAYRFNPAGNPVGMSINHTVYHYGYNAHNQLTSFNVTGDGTFYPKNNAGNRIKARYYNYALNNNIHSIITIGRTQGPAPTIYTYALQTGEPNRLLNISKNGIATTNYQYDPRGDITHNPSDGIYTYNDLNQLKSYQSNLDQKHPIHIMYKYASDGLLASESSTLNQEPIVFYYGKDGALEGQSQGTSKAFYLRGLANIIRRGGPLCPPNKKGRVQRPSPTNGPAITYLYETLQNNVALTTNYKNHKINITSQNVYMPYGEETNIKHGGQKIRPYDISQNHFGYTGQAKDPLTNWMMLGGFRYYSPQIARFLHRDTYNAFHKKPVYNPYVYVKSNPVRFSDPTGHLSWQWKWFDGVVKSNWNWKISNGGMGPGGKLLTTLGGITVGLIAALGWYVHYGAKDCDYDVDSDQDDGGSSQFGSAASTMGTLATGGGSSAGASGSVSDGIRGFSIVRIKAKIVSKIMRANNAFEAGSLLGGTIIRGENNQISEVNNRIEEALGILNNNTQHAEAFKTVRSHLEAAQKRLQINDTDTTLKQSWQLGDTDFVSKKLGAAEKATQSVQ